MVSELEHGEAICKECSRKIDLPDGILRKMSMEEFRQYIDFYNQNEALRNAFTETYRILEDDRPLYESDGNILRCHRSNALGF